ncbi:MAG TPA: hypothetical protein VGM12_05015 [Trebonia sp.]
MVQVAGGWLCDMGLAGWEVNVVTADHDDQRALRILGVRGHHLDSAVSRPVYGPCLQALAVQAELYCADERVRRMVHTIAEANMTDIRVWGETWPGDFEDRADLVSHRLSSAARAFKAQALVAASAASWPAETEEFRRGAIRQLALA